ncbi:hypothetical protein Tco_0482411 [Tanacetum coccineum]
MTTLHDLIAQAMQKKEEEKRIAEVIMQAAKERYWKIPICDDDDDNDYTIAITPVLSTEEPVNKVQVKDTLGGHLLKIAMSSDNASSTVTYTSVSSDSNGPSSWGISLVNAGEIPELDPYEEVAQQRQAHPLSPAFIPDPMELDEHVPVYVPEPKHLEYHVPADDNIQAEDQPYADDASPIAESPGYIADSNSMEDDTDTDSIDYPDEPVTGDEDPEDEDLEEDPSEEHDPEDDDEPFEDSDETKPFEEDETGGTPPSPRRRQGLVVVLVLIARTYLLEAAGKAEDVGMLELYQL